MTGQGGAQGRSGSAGHSTRRRAAPSAAAAAGQGGRTPGRRACSRRREGEQQPHRDGAAVQRPGKWRGDALGRVIRPPASRTASACAARDSRRPGGPRRPGRPDLAGLPRRRDRARGHPEPDQQGRRRERRGVGQQRGPDAEQPDQDAAAREPHHLGQLEVVSVTAVPTPYRSPARISGYTAGRAELKGALSIVTTNKRATRPTSGRPGTAITSTRIRRTRSQPIITARRGRRSASPDRKTRPGTRHHAHDERHRGQQRRPRPVVDQHRQRDPGEADRRPPRAAGPTTGRGTRPPGRRRRTSLSRLVPEPHSRHLSARHRPEPELPASSRLCPGPP